MSLYIKLYSSFWSHKKTLRLRSLIGDEALWVVPRLWSYAAENQPDGDFSAYSDSEVGMLLGYNKDATSMLQALTKSGFMDGNRILHDWSEWNGFHKSFSDRAKTAANARWKDKKKVPKKRERDEMRGEETSIALSIASSMVTKPPNDQSFIEEIKKLYPKVNVNSEINKMRAWLLTPAGRGRKINRRFMVNWLNKIDTEIDFHGHKSSQISGPTLSEKMEMQK